jgi:hypothetical protein
MKRTVLAVYLLGVYLISATVNCYLLQRASGYTPSDIANSIRGEIAGVHGVFIAILIGGIFVKKADTTKVSALIAALSITLSITWAAYVASSWVGYPTIVDSEALLGQMAARAKEGSFLVAGMLAFVCGSSPRPNVTSAAN